MIGRRAILLRDDDLSWLGELGLLPKLPELGVDGVSGLLEELAVEAVEDPEEGLVELVGDGVVIDVASSAKLSGSAGEKMTGAGEGVETAVAAGVGVGAGAGFGSAAGVAVGAGDGAAGGVSIWVLIFLPSAPSFGLTLQLMRTKIESKIVLIL